MIQGYETAISEAKRFKQLAGQKKAEVQDRAQEMRQHAEEKQAGMRRQINANREESIARAESRQQSAVAGTENLRAHMEARTAEQESTAGETMDVLNTSFLQAQNQTRGLEAPPPMPLDTTELVNAFVAKVQLAIEVVYGAALGIKNMPMLIPAVLSMVTGMLNASLAVKILVPGSSLPGVFIIVLPLVTTPIFWAIFNIIFQIVGGLDLLLGLMLLAFLPCLYTFVGT